MKAVLGLILLVVIATVSADAVSQNQSEIIGNCELGKNLLAQVRTTMSPRTNGNQKYHYSYPMFGLQGANTIKCIKFTDNFQNGTNGYAIITDGGINDMDVQLSILSQTGQGLDYSVEIWGQ